MIGPENTDDLSMLPLGTIESWSSVATLWNKNKKPKSRQKEPNESLETKGGGREKVRKKGTGWGREREVPVDII